MRILRIAATLDPASGGVAKALLTTSTALVSRGWHIEVVCLDSIGSPWLQSYPFPVHALGPGRFGWSYSRNFVPWLYAELARFDYVIIEGLWHYPATFAARVCSRLRKPYFVFPHGMLDPWFQRDPSRRFKAIRNIIYWIVFERRTVARADAVLFTCEEEKKLARKTFHFYRPKEELVVGLGVPQPPLYIEAQRAAFDSYVPDLFVGRPYWLFLGRIHPKKGVDILIQAYAEIIKKNKISQLEIPALVIAGPLDSDYAQGMQQMASALLGDDLSRCIIFTGMIDGDAKWGAFYGSEAFVLSSHQENFGIAVIEALACGKPVLISDQINIWREIVDAGAGLVGADNLIGTRELLERWLMMSRNNKDRYRERAYHAYQQIFSVETAIGKLLAVLA